MSWNDWETIWRRQVPPAGATAVVEETRRTFEAQRRKLRRTVVVRNVCEGGAGLVLTPVVAGLGWHLGKAGWPLLISAALFFAVTCVFIFDLIRMGRRRPGPGATLVAKLDAEIAELRHQRRLMRNWSTWYLLPCVVAILIALFTLDRANHGRAPEGLLKELLTTPATLAWIVVLVASFALALGLAWRAVRLSVARHIDPRIVELEALRRDLAASE